MDAEEQKLYTFIELPIFMRQFEALASFETLYAIQADLLADPEGWPVIKGTAGHAKDVSPTHRIHAVRAGAFAISISTWSTEAGSVALLQ